MIHVKYVGAGSYGYPGLGIFRSGEVKEATKEQAARLWENKSFQIWADNDSELFDPTFDGKPYLGFIGNIDTRSGYGSGSIDILRALSRAGYEVSTGTRLGAHPQEVHPEARRFMETPKPTRPQVEIMHTIADNFHLGTSPIQIGWTMWETSKIPAVWHMGGKEVFGDWAKLMNDNCEYVVAPSKHSKQLFEDCGVKRPIHVINYGLDFSEWQFREKPRNEKFTIVQFGDLTHRKGPLEAVDAFRLAFPKERDVQLIFKTHHGRLGAGNRNIPHFNDPRIKVHDEYWTRDYLKSFISYADCMIWLSRGEGFGLPPLQAAAMGVPVVTTTHTGMAEYYNEKYFWGVEDEGMESAITLPGEWPTPSVESAAAQLRKIYDDYTAAQKKAKLASQYVRKNFNLDVFAKNIDSYLRSIL